MTVKNTFAVGFMLFAIFFGAGNLIFPPKIAFESGEHFLPTMVGFIITGVGLPMLGIIVSAFYKGGYKAALDAIHPWFSLIFLSAIYLSIGPFFAGPRTGATAYEFTVVPLWGEAGNLSLFIFTAIYFVLTAWLSLNPSKIVDRVGAILTPILIITILLVVVRAFFVLDEPLRVPDTTGQSWFFRGVIEGYSTMDALASVAFSVIVINAIKSKSAEPAAFFKQMVFAGVIAAIALGLIYFSIGWIGNNMTISPETLTTLNERQQDLGSYILNTITTQVFGEYGGILLGVIVTLACFTTSIGLCVSVSEYFNEIFPKISYRTYVLIFCIVSFAIANLGLKAVIEKSVPMLLVLYPIAMTMILLLGANALYQLPLLAKRLSLAFVTIISILSVANVEFIAQLPLKSYSMEWLPFAVLGLVIGFVVHAFSRK